MLSVILKEDPSLEVTLMYSTKLPSESPKPEEVLFLPRILELFSSAHALSDHQGKNRIELFFTGLGEDDNYPDFDEILDSLHTPDLPIVISPNRMALLDMSIAVGSKEEQRSSVVYVCGPPNMTDEITKFLRRQQNIGVARVLCEKWW
jgi:predicted ferric reductase